MVSNRFSILSGDGGTHSVGMTLEQARERAQEVADQTGEPCAIYAEPTQEDDEPVEVIEPSDDDGHARG